MSQFPQSPSPYPQQVREPQADPSRAARNASTLMWVLSILAVAFGFCVALLFAPMIDRINHGDVPGSQENLDQARAMFQQMESQLAATGVSLSAFLMVVGIGIIAVGGLFGLMAFFVRRGGMAPAIISLAMVVLAIGYFFLNVLVSLSMGGGASNICPAFLAIGLFGVLGYWLILAIQSAAAAGVARRPTFRGGPQGEFPQQPQLPTQVPMPPASQGYGPPPYGPPGGVFTPAPFGIPPPPGDTPGRFGYATRPNPPASPQQPPPAAGQPSANPPALDPPPPSETP